MTLKKRYHYGRTRAQIRDLPACTHCGNSIGPGEPYVYEEDEAGDARASHALPLYFDECALAIREMLTNLGFCVVPGPPRGTPDVDWLAEAGEKGWTVITQDRRISRRKDELDAIVRHRVKCFVIPARTRNRWDEIQGFVSMWDKIRIESFCAGPFIWQFNDESSPVRCELIYPEALEFAAYDLSDVPVGHLLNLFADVVAQHDQGWFSVGFVNDLHNNIRTEIEARITDDRSKAIKPANGGTLFASHELGPGVDAGSMVALKNPMDLDEIRLASLRLSLTDDNKQYLWLIPAQKLAANLVDAGQSDEVGPHSLYLECGPVGFKRSGFGLLQQPKPKAR